MKKLRIILTKIFLIQEYIKNKKSMNQIAKEVGCSQGSVRKYLIKYSISRRVAGKSNEGKPRCDLVLRNKLRNQKGKKNGNYKHGETLKKHYCKETRCNNEIHYDTWKSGQGRCKSCTGKYRWKNKEYREKYLKFFLKTSNITPNKPEKLLNKLLNKILPKTYTFVGNGKLIVGSFCPDFVNKDNNKIIEVFGCYWHKCQECGFGKRKLKPKDVGRLKEYKKAGYKTLIIWEHELKDINRVKERILLF